VKIYPVKRREVKQTATVNYRLEQVATALAAALAAGLSGWALALALGLWGDAASTKLPPWKPFALRVTDFDGAVAASAPVASGNARLAGVAGDRAYFMVGGAAGGPGARSLSLAAGDSLPSGERIVRVERDAVVVASAGAESRLTVFGVRADAQKNLTAPLVACRLSSAERASAIFLEPAMVKALQAERATFARMFDPLPGPGAGIRARGTGGTTAMFAIEDGDVLLRADGAPLRSSEAITGEILARVERGGSVLVEGERRGTPRRWIYAPAGCAAQTDDATKASRPSG
jgi:hypothetical protein